MQCREWEHKQNHRSIILAYMQRNYFMITTYGGTLLGFPASSPSELAETMSTVSSSLTMSVNTNSNPVIGGGHGGGGAATTQRTTHSATGSAAYESTSRRTEASSWPTRGDDYSSKMGIVVPSGSP